VRGFRGRVSRFCSVALLALLLPPLGAAGAAGAAAGATHARPPIAADRLARLRGDLLAGDDEQTARAAHELGDSGASNASWPLIEALVIGQPPDAAHAALDALAKLGDPRAADVLALYAGHRRAELRLAAVNALAAIAEAKSEAKADTKTDTKADAPVTATLIERLGDAEAGVRAAAAAALADRHARAAVPRLLLLVQRNDPGAAAALGRLATPDVIPRLGELLGAVDDAVLATALGEYIKRRDVADPLRVDVLHTLDRVQGAAATAALADYLSSIPPHDDRPSRREAQRLLDGRSANP
jgi:HEAT repeat protein